MRANMRLGSCSHSPTLLDALKHVLRFDYQVRRGVTVEEAQADPSLERTLELLLTAHCGDIDPELEAIGGGDNPVSDWP